MGHVYRWLKGPLNPYVSWSAMCYTKTLDKMHRWQTLWLRLRRAVNLKARVSKLYIDRGEKSKIDSFSSRNLLWYSVNLLLCCCFHVTLPKGLEQEKVINTSCEEKRTDVFGAPAFRKAKRLQPSPETSADKVIGWKLWHCFVAVPVTGAY